MRTTLRAGASMNGELTLALIGIVAPAAAATALTGFVDALVLCGQRGGFCAAGAAPSYSRLDVRGLSRLLQDGVAFDFEAMTVDARVLRLVQAFVLREIHVSPATNLELWQRVPPFTGTVQDFSSYSWEEEETLYPETTDKLGFPFDFDKMADPRMRRCLVELQGLCDASLVTQMTEWIEGWTRLLEMGAFALPRDDPEEAISVMGTVTQFDARIIELVVDRFDANETAWDVLLNLLGRFDCDCAPIASVKIG